MAKILIEVLIAFLSLFGAYCLSQVISAFLFIPKNVACAVVVNSKESLDMLDETLGQASNALFRVRHRHIVVVFSADLFSDNKDLTDECLMALNKYGATWVFANTHSVSKSE